MLWRLCIIPTTRIAFPAWFCVRTGHRWTLLQTWKVEMKQQPALHSDGWHNVRCCWGSFTFSAKGRSQFLHLLLNLFGTAGWPAASSASRHHWTQSCTIFYGKCTSSSAGREHPGSQSLGGNDSPTRGQVRDRWVPVCLHWFQLFFILPHSLSIFLSLLTSGPVMDCLTTSHNHVGTNSYNKSLISLIMIELLWVNSNQHQMLFQRKRNLKVGSLYCFYAT